MHFYSFWVSQKLFEIIIILIIIINLFTTAKKEIFF